MPFEKFDVPAAQAKVTLLTSWTDGKGDRTRGKVKRCLIENDKVRKSKNTFSYLGSSIISKGCRACNSRCGSGTGAGRAARAGAGYTVCVPIGAKVGG